LSTGGLDVQYGSHEEHPRIRSVLPHVESLLSLICLRFPADNQEFEEHTHVFDFAVRLLACISVFMMCF
jgi:hypothetical protein